MVYFANLLQIVVFYYDSAFIQDGVNHLIIFLGKFLNFYISFFVVAVIVV